MRAFVRTRSTAGGISGKELCHASSQNLFLSFLPRAQKGREVHGISLSISVDGRLKRKGEVREPDL